MTKRWIFQQKEVECDKKCMMVFVVVISTIFILLRKKIIGAIEDWQKEALGKVTIFNVEESWKTRSLEMEKLMHSQILCEFSKCCQLMQLIFAYPHSTVQNNKKQESSFFCIILEIILHFYKFNRYNPCLILEASIFSSTVYWESLQTFSST